MENNDVTLVAGVDQGLALQLRCDGIHTIEPLLDGFDEARLAELQRPWGNRTQRVGKKAASILRMAQAMASGNEELVQTPDIPDYNREDLEATWAVKQSLKPNPKLTVTRLPEFFPISNFKNLDAYLDGLRKAGLPD